MKVYILLTSTSVSLKCVRASIWLLSSIRNERSTQIYTRCRWFHMTCNLYNEAKLDCLATVMRYGTRWQCPDYTIYICIYTSWRSDREKQSGEYLQMFFLENRISVIECFCVNLWHDFNAAREFFFNRLLYIKLSYLNWENKIIQIHIAYIVCKQQYTWITKKKKRWHLRLT